MLSGKGAFFHALVGQNPADLGSIIEIEKSVERVTGKALPVKFYQSELVSPRGSVFPISYNQEIDVEATFFNL